MTTITSSLLFFRRTLCVSMAAVLLGTSCPGVEAASSLFCDTLTTVASDSLPILNTQALNARATFVHSAAGPSLAAWNFVMKSRNILAGQANFARSGLWPAQKALGIVLRVGHYGFSLLNEWGHLTIAFILFPYKAKSIFTPQNIRGNQSWSTFWGRGLMSGQPDGANPSVVLPFIKGPIAHHVVNIGGFVASLIPVAALVWFGVQDLFDAALDPLGLLTTLAGALSMTLVVGTMTSVLSAWWSDILFADVPGQYNCGNLFLNILTAYQEGELGLQTVVDLEIPVTVGEKVLEPGYELPAPTHLRMTVEELLMHMLGMLDVRGRLQAGIVLYQMKGTLTTKINTPKRSPLNEALLRRFVADANRSGKLEFEDGILRISAHVRAPTQPAKSKKLETVSAQPQQYQLDRNELVGEFATGTDGKVNFVEKQRKIIVKQGHNGDADQMIIHNEVLDKSDHMYAVLDKVFGLVGTEPVGDSKALAGITDVFFVQGRSGASARLAYHTRVIQTANQKSDQVLFPSQEVFANVGAVLTSAIRQQTELRRLGSPNMLLSQVPDSQLIELKSRLLRTVIKDSERGSLQTVNSRLPARLQLHADLIDSLMYPGGSQSIAVDASVERGVKDLLARPLADRLVLIDGMVDSYFKNTLYEAMSQAMAYMEGTFGIVLETVDASPDNEETVVFARGQNMSIGWDSSSKFNFGASSRQALDLLRFHYHLSNEGQVFGISFRRNPNTGNREFKFRSRVEKNGGQDLTAQQIEEGVIDRHGNRWMENPPVTFAHHDDLMMAEMMQIPGVYNAFLDSLNSPVEGSTYHASNLHTLQTLTDILSEIATGQRRSKIAITGSEKSGEAGKTLIRTIKAMTSAGQLSAEYIPPSDILKWVGAGWLRFIYKKLGLTSDTLGVVISASGGDTFETARSAEVMTRFLDDMVVFAGLWNIELADVMGQKLHANSDPSGRIVNSKGGWSRLEVSTLPDAAMEFALGQTFLRAFQAVKARHPDSKSLHIDLEDEDFRRLLGKITDEYLEHAGRILGVKMNGRLPALDDAGQPIAEETPEHAAIVKDAERFALHSNESVVINDIILPLFYATIIYFGVHLLPSTWSIFPALTVVWNNSIGLLPYIGAALASLSHLDWWFWQKMPSAVQMLLTFGSGATHFTFYILANAVMVAVIPLIWMRIYRAATGREGRRRSGTAVTVLIDRARDKIMNLYAKPQASMFNHQEPFFISATLRSALHNFSFRIRRGTLIIMSMSSSEGIDQSERNASIMVRNQAEMVKSQGTGAEIVTFDHLPYSVPIRAPYENYIKETAKALKFSPEQTLQFRDFVAQLPETINNFKRMHRDKLLADLPRAVGVMLGLDGERLELFNSGFEHYMERQFAFEEVFRTNFGDAENWLKHYVFAHAWAKANANAWYLRLAIKVFKLPVVGKALHNWIKDHAPIFDLYIDISRTFVGTGRLTTASPFDGSVAAKIMHLPSKLVDRSAKLPPSVAANVVPFNAKPNRSEITELATEPAEPLTNEGTTGEGTTTFDDVFDVIKRAKALQKHPRIDVRKGTSVVIKAAGQPVNFSTEGDLFLDKEGNVVGAPGFPAASKKVIEQVIEDTGLVARLVKTSDQRPLGFTVAPLSNRPSYYVHQDAHDGLRGLILIDTHLVDAVEQGEKQHPGARDALYLELWDEIYHAGGLTDESEIQLAKLYAFGRLASDARRSAVIKYWEANAKEEYGYHLLLKKFHKIYKSYMKAHNAEPGGPQGRKTAEGKQKLIALKEDAIVAAIREIGPDLEAYLNRISGEELPKVVSNVLAETDTVGSVTDPEVAPTPDVSSVLDAPLQHLDATDDLADIRYQPATAGLSDKSRNAVAKFFLNAGIPGSRPYKIKFAIGMVFWPSVIGLAALLSLTWRSESFSTVTRAFAAESAHVLKKTSKVFSSTNRKPLITPAVTDLKPTLPSDGDVSAFKKSQKTLSPEPKEKTGEISVPAVEKGMSRIDMARNIPPRSTSSGLDRSRVTPTDVQKSTALDESDDGTPSAKKLGRHSGARLDEVRQEILDLSAVLASANDNPSADQVREIRKYVRFLENEDPETLNQLKATETLKRAKTLLKQHGGSAWLGFFGSFGAWAGLLPLGFRRSSKTNFSRLSVAA